MIENYRSTYIASLDKVASDQKVLLVGRDLDVVGSNDGLSLLGVVKTLDVVQVGDVKSSDVVSEGQGEVSEFAIVRNIRVYGDGLLGLVSKVVQELSNTLITLGVLAEGVDDPDRSSLDSADYC